ncbi:DNA repair protein RadC [Pseudomonas putida S11]|nr:DNA repair protein RadC [Pseudomonas putida S11]
MRLHKLKASDPTGTYLVESPVTETDILLIGPLAGESLAEQGHL